eukprot:TRINITY_DN28760_c0_g1_i1.p1 TRINITY_DN28760_c0_g1~~TRINITY_DN28760_c0_g1_i1.p1  ORF type:complete len:679 (+),score=165.58 TRINITY_DN28760_c0_g1_i1:139-2037(+)
MGCILATLVVWHKQVRRTCLSSVRELEDALTSAADIAAKLAQEDVAGAEALLVSTAGGKSSCEEEMRLREHLRELCETLRRPGSCAQLSTQESRTNVGGPNPLTPLCGWQAKHVRSFLPPQLTAKTTSTPNPRRSSPVPVERWLLSRRSSPSGRTCWQEHDSDDACSEEWRPPVRHSSGTASDTAGPPSRRSIGGNRLQFTNPKAHCEFQSCSAPSLTAVFDIESRSVCSDAAPAQLEDDESCIWDEAGEIRDKYKQFRRASPLPVDVFPRSVREWQCMVCISASPAPAFSGLPTERKVLEDGCTFASIIENVARRHRATILRLHIDEGQLRWRCAHGVSARRCASERAPRSAVDGVAALRAVAPYWTAFAGVVCGCGSIVERGPQLPEQRPDTPTGSDRPLSASTRTPQPIRASIGDGSVERLAQRALQLSLALRCGVVACRTVALSARHRFFFRLADCVDEDLREPELFYELGPQRRDSTHDLGDAPFDPPFTGCADSSLQLFHRATHAMITAGQPVSIDQAAPTLGEAAGMLRQHLASYPSDYMARRLLCLAEASIRAQQHLHPEDRRALWRRRCTHIQPHSADSISPHRAILLTIGLCSRLGKAIPPPLAVLVRLFMQDPQPWPDDLC